MGDRHGWLDKIEGALIRLPRHGALWVRLMSLLAGTGQSGRAADIAARLRREGGDAPALRLIEARHAGTEGQSERAGALLASIPPDMPESWVDRGRHALRLGHPEHADFWLARAREVIDGDPAAWALTELVWRATGDARHRWLLDPETMIRRVSILTDHRELDRLGMVLRAIHRNALPPIGQSVRSGTQTRGSLADRGEQEIGDLFRDMTSGLDDFRRNLRPADPSHPILRHRNRPWKIAASWSIRLTDGGYHVSHLHNHGILSSALHVAVPQPQCDKQQEGWLELGRPPAGIDLALGPIATVKPEPGTLILFPSFLYHGTRPFPSGERLTVAIDVAPSN
ncbi:2OG-Fe(II) oxygenase family protein [Sphingomonas sp. BGYR3]|uniref:2OG-Fe(II) oxygenase family protein n=1 Tax=Sphingomonas sp. BGYR3 TaxID=2975483 RepID=UPI0021A53C4A|nr:2OG-Fe(II) oxygenase family protein [Sphingomonas sp. BGYR3]MDG5489003.1 2OG-Fe(II) oxygenase family protein [Sphingomonas sp. BGYR3]